MTENYVNTVVWLKQCTKCGSLKPKTPEYYHRNNRSDGWGDGFYARCKECRKKHDKRYDTYDPEYYHRPEVHERRLEYFRQYRKRDYVKKYNRQLQDRVNKRNPEYRKAHSAVNGAVQKGELPPALSCTCAKCGQPSAEYHHWSYEEKDWLDVIPLCRLCHRAVHKMNKKRRYQVEFQLRNTSKIAA